MARIRTIKPEFWTSEQILSVSRDARLLFIGLWNFCDDGGNHPASLVTLKANVFPADNLSMDEIRRLVDELSSNGLLQLYEHSAKKYWHVTGWQHQKIDRPTIKYPEYKETNNKIDEPSSSIRRVFDEPSPPEGKGRDIDKDKRGTRLPPQWKLSKELIDWSLAEGFSRALIDSQERQFIDYWIAIPGQKGVKLDWNATWRRWIRNSYEGKATKQKAKFHI